MCSIQVEAKFLSALISRSTDSESLNNVLIVVSFLLAPWQLTGFEIWIFDQSNQSTHLPCFLRIALQSWSSAASIDDENDIWALQYHVLVVYSDPIIWSNVVNDHTADGLAPWCRFLNLEILQSRPQQRVFSHPWNVHFRYMYFTIHFILFRPNGFLELSSIQ